MKTPSAKSKLRMDFYIFILKRGCKPYSFFLSSWACVTNDGKNDKAIWYRVQGINEIIWSAGARTCNVLHDENPRFRRCYQLSHELTLNFHFRFNMATISNCFQLCWQTGWYQGRRLVNTVGEPLGGLGTHLPRKRGSGVLPRKFLKN